MSKLRIAVPAKPGAKNIENYLNALRQLDAEPVLTDAPANAAAFDGLLLPGGGDADPALYGQKNIACKSFDRALDDLQMASLDAFIHAGKPILGICRGEQLIDIYFGGSLIQDLPTARDHRHDDSADKDRAHMTRAVPGSFLDKLYGTRFSTNSSHHQGVDRLGDGIEAVQWADDGVVEGIVHKTLPIWAVQWHPERMCFEHRRADTVDGSLLIDMFLRECQRRR